ncbi:MAG: hypothetical protein ACI9LM_002928 [Alteromonadaceae bacterium]|jgi:hypothetical protein
MRLTNMKLTKVLTAALFTIIASTSIQAVELVKVEQANKVEFSNILQLDLAQSVKSMQVKAINVVASAKTLLIAQNAKIVNDSELPTSKSSLVAE